MMISPSGMGVPSSSRASSFSAKRLPQVRFCRSAGVVTTYSGMGAGIRMIRKGLPSASVEFFSTS